MRGCIENIMREQCRILVILHTTVATFLLELSAAFSFGLEACNKTVISKGHVRKECLQCFQEPSEDDESQFQ